MDEKIDKSLFNFSRSESQRYVSYLEAALAHARGTGKKPRWNKRYLVPLLLSHLRSSHGAGASDRASHGRRHRPARIAEWITRILRGQPLHHISSYSISSLRGSFLKSGSLHEAGRDTAKLPPPYGRDFCGGRCPAQPHQQFESKDPNSSEIAQDADSLASIPARPKTGKNRRETRSEQAWFNRKERTREKRAKHRREYRQLKARWKGLTWEDPRPDLHLGTPGSQANKETNHPASRDKMQIHTQSLPSGPRRARKHAEKTSVTAFLDTSHERALSLSLSSSSSSSSSSPRLLPRPCLRPPRPPIPLQTWPTLTKKTESKKTWPS